MNKTKFRILAIISVIAIISFMVLYGYMMTTHVNEKYDEIANDLSCDELLIKDERRTLTAMTFNYWQLKTWIDKECWELAD